MLAGLIGGGAVLVASCWVETRDLAAGDLAASARLPVREHPLWAAIYLLPPTIAFLITGPISGYLSDRYGARAFATAGPLVVATSFLGLLLIPANFPYWLFGVLIAINGLGSGLFSSPNTTAIMNSVGANRRGAPPSSTPARRCRSESSSR